MARVNPPMLIGLGGKLRSGKDAFADHLVENYGYIKMGMSDPLNEMLLILDPYIPVGVHTRGIPSIGPHIRYSHLHEEVGYVEAKKNPEVRRLLQKLGTDVGRKKIHTDVWVRMAKKRITKNMDNGIPTVITAMRFPNELRMLSELSGLSLWVSRPGSDPEALEGAYRAGQSTISSHESETSVDKTLFDAEIINDGTLLDLGIYADRLISRYKAQGLERIKGFSYHTSPDIKYGRSKQ